jgi:hypothetical protein
MKNICVLKRGFLTKCGTALEEDVIKILIIIEIATEHYT